MRASLFLSLLSTLTATLAQPQSQHHGKRQDHVPQPPTGVKTITTANNITIRYKEPGKEDICETTPGVKSYSGYVDLSPTSHTFFYFFEARHDPQNAPITLWLNGGPGSDSLIGLFEGMILLPPASPPAMANANECRKWPVPDQPGAGIVYQSPFVE